MSTSAVAMIVSDPPPVLSGTQRALPKKRLGFSSEFASMPPVSVRPLPSLRRVVRPREPCDGIEDEDDVLPHFREAARAFERDLGDLDVAFGPVVEARSGHFAEARRLHLRHFLRALVDEEDEDSGVRMILRDSLGDRLKDHGLAGLRGRDDEGPLAHPHGTDEIDDPVRVVGLPAAFESAFQPEPPVGVDRAQAVELPAPSELVGSVAVHGVEIPERGALSGARGPAGLTADLVSRPQVVARDDLRAHVDVGVARRVPGVLAPDEARAVAEPLDESEVAVLRTFRDFGDRGLPGAALLGTALLSRPLPSPVAAAARTAAAIPAFAAGFALAAGFASAPARRTAARL